MRIVFLMLIALHALIHLMGVVKAFNLAEIKELTLPITKPLGAVWLSAFIVLVLAAVQYGIKNDWWWLTAFIGILISQALVFSHWQDAKFGTIANCIVFLIATIAFAEFIFERKTTQTVEKVFSQKTIQDRPPVAEDRLTSLPEPVQAWLNGSGVFKGEAISTARLKQVIRLKMKPEQETWTNASAEQYFSVEQPAFVWAVKMQMMPMLNVSGRDTFLDGSGQMVIKVFSLFPVINVNSTEKLNSGTLQRYLAEIVWFPSAALSPYISWEAIDKFSAKAIMTYKGTTGDGVFYFDEKGNFKKFSALRYMGGDDHAVLREWIVTAAEHKSLNGVTIPTKLNAAWMLENKNWTWLELEITSIDYNRRARY